MKNSRSGSRCKQAVEPKAAAASWLWAPYPQTSLNLHAALLLSAIQSSVNNRLAIAYAVLHIWARAQPDCNLERPRKEFSELTHRAIPALRVNLERKKNSSSYRPIMGRVPASPGMAFAPSSHVCGWAGTRQTVSIADAPDQVQAWMLQIADISIDRGSMGGH